jgi:hypothetical protein
MKRRTSFATPVVLVAVASCHAPTHSNPPGPVNPPSPRIMTIDECSAVEVGEACSYDHGTCSIGAEDGCGLQGYECKETTPGTFTWVEQARPCDLQ